MVARRKILCQIEIEAITLCKKYKGGKQDKYKSQILEDLLELSNGSAPLEKISTHF